MRRKSSGPDESNLELLLDTICNTFGVVLFISMLVVIRVNATQAEVETQPPEIESELELIERQQRLDEARAQLEQLKKALAQQQSVADRFTSTESRELALIVQEQGKILANRLHLKRQALTNITINQQTINDVASELEQQHDQLQSLRQEAAAIQSQLKTEVAQRSRSSKAPELRESQRTPVPIFVKDGQLCRYFLPGKYLSPNTQEVRKTVDQAAQVHYVDPVSGAGLAISPDPPNSDQIKAALTGFSSQDHVLQVFFWPESFPHCQVLRDVMVDMGFRYSLIPMPDGERVSVGQGSGPVFEQ